MIKRILIIVIAVFSASYIAAEGVYSGGDIARSGELISIIGDIVEIDDELYISSDSGKYQLHFGPEEYAISIGFEKEDGYSASISGYHLDNHISPMDIVVGDKIYRFWDEARRPLWSGKRYTKGEGEHDDHDEHE